MLLLLLTLGTHLIIATGGRSSFPSNLTCVTLKRAVETVIFSRKMADPVSTLTIRASFPHRLFVQWNTTASPLLTTPPDRDRSFIMIKGRVIGSNPHVTALIHPSKTALIPSTRSQMSLYDNITDIPLAKSTVIIHINITINGKIRRFSRSLNYTKILRAAPNRFAANTYNTGGKFRLSFSWSSRTTRERKRMAKKKRFMAAPKKVSTAATLFRVSPKAEQLMQVKSTGPFADFNLNSPLVSSSLHRIRIDVKPTRKMKIVSTCLFQVNSRGLISASETDSVYQNVYYPAGEDGLEIVQVTTTTTPVPPPAQPVALTPTPESCKISAETGDCRRGRNSQRKKAGGRSSASTSAGMIDSGIGDQWPWCAGPGECPENNTLQRIVLVRRASFRGKDYAAVKLAWFRIRGNAALATHNENKFGRQALNGNGANGPMLSRGTIQKSNQLNIGISIRTQPSQTSQLLLALMSFQPVARSLFATTPKPSDNQRRVVRDLLLVILRGNELVFTYQSLCSKAQVQSAKLDIGRPNGSTRRRRKSKKTNSKSIVLKIDIAKDVFWFRTVDRDKGVNVVSMLPNRIVVTDAANRSDVPPFVDGTVDCSTTPRPLFSLFTDLYIGGLPSYLFDMLSLQHFSVNFTGCVRQLVVNGRTMVWRPVRYGGYVSEATPIADCNAKACYRKPCSGPQTVCAPSSMRQRTCLCSTLTSRATLVDGLSGQTCDANSSTRNKWLHKATLLHFNSLSHLEMAWAGVFVQEEFVIRLNFKPNTVQAGMFLFARSESVTNGDYFLLYLESGSVILQLNSGGGPVAIRTRQSAVVGEWNLLEISKNKTSVTVKLNTGRPSVSTLSNAPASRSPASALNVRDPVYVGGVPLFSPLARNDRLSGFSGCLDQLQLNAYRLQWLPHAIRLFGVTTCPHACDANPCKNGATCVPQGDFYVCFCRRGFSGFQCQQSVGIYSRISALP